MSWFSEGAAAADAVSASMVSKRKRNFFTDQKKSEKAVIRFLRPASESFNYKRSFVKWARGEKMQTSYDTPECPLVQNPDLQLQATFAWPIIDRRILKFVDAQTNEAKEVGPRVMYFADGGRTRKQLIAFEAQMLADENEARAEDGKEPLKLEQYNLTHYDLTVTKAQKAPWVITAKRPKTLSKEDLELVEKNPIDLAEEVQPLPLAELRALIGGPVAAPASNSEEDTVSYSYSEDDDEIKLD